MNDVDDARGAAITTNQTSMIGPEDRADLGRAEALGQKQERRASTMVSGTTQSSNAEVAITSPSSAPRIEMAGVIMPSP